MPQFFLPKEARRGERFLIEGPEAYHILRVLRFKAGDALTLFDGEGGRFTGVIDAVHDDKSLGGPLKALPPAPRRGPRLTLYAGLLKGSHWDLVLEKGTELGVDAFVPVVTPRAVVQVAEEKSAAKLARWEKIILAAAKQSGRESLPSVSAPKPFADAIREACARGKVLLAWEGLKGASSRDALAGLSAAGEIAVFIGPEGGFTKDETELAQSLGAELFGLGENILRAETAALAAVCLVRHASDAL